MTILSIIFWTAFALIVLFLISAEKFGNKKFSLAKQLENDGKFKDACENYAIAILNGSTHKKKCKEKVKLLWDKYGPFDYEDELYKIKECNDDCGEAGYHAMMSIIDEITQDDKNTSG